MSDHLTAASGRVGDVQGRLYGLLLDAYGIVRTLEDKDAVALALEIDLVLMELRDEVAEGRRLLDEFQGREN